MTRLESILKEFTKNGLPESERKSILDGSVEPPYTFVTIAKEVLSGYFSVKGIKSEIRVIPTTVEFYYHEEGEHNVKDLNVYHRNSKISKKKKPVELFQIGFLHNHVSGIDITFEHHAHNTDCRASVLIRAFSVEVNGQLERKNESRSTMLYEYLFSKCDIFNGISVEWKDGNPVELDLPYKVRKNVALYKGENKVLACELQEGQEPTENKKNVQCPRLWQFSSKQ